MVIKLEQISAFFLVFARIAGMLPLTPVFNSREVITWGKIAVIFWTSLIMVWFIPMPIKYPDSSFMFFIAIISEFTIGVIIGYSVQMLVMAVEFAGMLIDTQSALAAASILDPGAGRSMTMLQKLINYIAVQAFLAVNAHHMLLSGIFQSFKLIPISSNFRINYAVFQMLFTGRDVFEIALHLSAPTLLMIFMVDYSLGMVNRIAPTVNVFQFSFQIKPWLSMILFGMIIPGTSDALYRHMETIMQRILELLLMMQV